MAQFIELQRSRLEELDVLEHATFKRFRKNPELIPSQLRQKDDVLSSKNPQPHKETLTQKHEIKIFNDRYNKLLHQINEAKTQTTLVNDSLDKLLDPEKNFETFDRLYDQLKMRKQGLIDDNLLSLYSMYSSSPMQEVKTTKNGKFKVRRKYILSQEASDKIDIDNMFSYEEQFGKYIDIHRFHEIYKELSKKPVTYLEFLHQFSDTQDLKFDNFNKELIHYFINFIEKTEPLTDISTLKHTIDNKFHTGDVKDGEFFCKPCDKPFKLVAMKSHMEGKKHKKNVAKLEVDQLEYQQFKLKYLADYLKEPIQATINNVERMEAMTEREKLMELEREAELSDYTTANSDPSDDSEKESDDEDNELFKELPLGADGVPIPFWLYKLQGLHRGFNCEICGNMEYKGRISFEKHFSSSKHQQGLRFLGIDDDSMNLFSNISKIEEAVELWKIIKREKRLKEGELDNAVEVEDNDGNVMSERDYLQLKKQGML